jgi:hypothetical protein
MTHVCSVILIRRSFDIYHEQQKISLHNESICCWRKIWQTILRFVHRIRDDWISMS